MRLPLGLVEYRSEPAEPSERRRQVRSGRGAALSEGMPDVPLPLRPAAAFVQGAHTVERAGKGWAGAIWWARGTRRSGQCREVPTPRSSGGLPGAGGG